MTRLQPARDWRDVIDEARDPEMRPFYAGIVYVSDCHCNDRACQLLHKQFFPIDDPAIDALCPPFHFGCLAHLIIITGGRFKAAIRSGRPYTFITRDHLRQVVDFLGPLKGVPALPEN